MNPTSDDRTPYVPGQPTPNVSPSTGQPVKPPRSKSRLWLVFTLVAGIIVVTTVVAVTLGGRHGADPATSQSGWDREQAAQVAIDASPTPSPTMGYAAACTEALKLLTGDSLNIVTDFVADPSMASISAERLASAIDRMTAIGPSLPAEVAASWGQLTGVIVALRSALTTGTNSTIDTGIYPDLAPGVFSACAPYVPDGALASVTPAAKPKPTKKAVPTIEEGIWTVGEDIPAGTYKVTETAGSDCYWARLKSNGDIIDNYLGGGRPKVKIRKGEQFETSGCPTFKKVG